ncbi:hypothetical protein LZ31DRAFT_2251 [Colletotrichum somersetense]|nr:hypothetical protein LZ31DRAFT_2251 [Colletotrichum somersetense]
MTDKLPPNLLALFAPRPPLRWVPPPDHAPESRRTLPVSGVAEFLPALQHYKETDEYHPTESWLQMRDRKKLEKQAAVERLKTEGPKNFKPHEDPNIRGDAFKTLIVARLSYEANEQDLEREFGRFGPIERIRIITDTHAHEKPRKKKKPHRGYAFVVFEREKDMRGNTAEPTPLRRDTACPPVPLPPSGARSSGLPALCFTHRDLWPSSLPISKSCFLLSLYSTMTQRYDIAKVLLTHAPWRTGE